MDYESLAGSTSQTEGKPAVTYDAIVTSPLVNGEAKLIIGKTAFTIAALFDVAEVPYTEVNELRYENYAVTVKADSGVYTFSRMGQWAELFYSELYRTYNKEVLRSLFIKGDPLTTANGDFTFTESGIQKSGAAPLAVYGNCVPILPPNLDARRIPLCFVRGMEKGNYSLTLILDTQERYTLSKLGYDTAPFEKAIEKQIRSLQEKSLAAAKELDPTLTTAQASQIAKLTVQGVAAPARALKAIAPSFVAALEGEISKTRAADYYSTLKELSESDSIWIGFKKNIKEGDADEPDTNEPGTDEPGTDKPGADKPDATALPEGGEEEALLESPFEAYAFFFIIPSPDGNYATVEFSEVNSATFVYQTNGAFESFAGQLNRALEAIDFKREVIRLSDRELLNPQYASYYMAAKRTTSLQLVRSHFVGRAIHSNPTTWKNNLLNLWSKT